MPSDADAKATSTALGVSCSVHPLAMLILEQIAASLLLLSIAHDGVAAENKSAMRLYNGLKMQAPARASRHPRQEENSKGQAEPAKKSVCNSFGDELC